MIVQFMTFLDNYQPLECGRCHRESIFRCDADIPLVAAMCILDNWYTLINHSDALPVTLSKNAFESATHCWYTS